MSAIVATIGGLVGGWLVIAALLAVFIGRAIRIADQRDGCHGANETPKRGAA